MVSHKNILLESFVFLFMMYPDLAFSHITPNIQQTSYFPLYNNKHLHIRCFNNPSYINNTNNNNDNDDTSSPKTVLFEAGTPFYSTIWGNVLNYMPNYLSNNENGKLIKQYCVYDRYGYGWSDFKGESVRSDEMVNDLQQYLGSIGIDDGIIYVGWSYGGVLAQELAATNPGILDGVVLVDSMDVLDLNDTLIQNIVQGVYSFKILDMIKVTGLTKFYDGYPLPSGYLSESINLDGQLKISNNMVYFGSDFLQSTVFELQVIMDSLGLLKSRIDSLAKGKTLLGDIPLVVLTALENQDEDWMYRQTLLSNYSSNSLHLTTNSSHFVPIGPTFYDIIKSIDNCISLGLK
ncbi:hypothetical protein DFA_02584 [Cavenderia fasciculata]|uniref:AB hydrolase-1 domain-containing protein n=1 Tax=Cavenderia fasciculata TaxID=261658 RepID=F4PZT1_CACFS|nr:uncharacterized protein DFA_02584 [Cavenderia fasciculata]EGG18845.1 hypothetical protein DFA_02584 [Cavenderia fasciculata]|eukprot:XP_004357307.1 hypothetical protein DFA_02584 [Cavenderia fasciculata]